jgi:hypothetical protein
MLRRVAFVGADVSEECIASNIKVTRIGALRTLAVTSNRNTPRGKSFIVLILSVFRLLVSANVIALFIPTLNTILGFKACKRKATRKPRNHTKAVTTIYSLPHNYESKPDDGR